MGERVDGACGQESGHMEKERVRLVLGMGEMPRSIRAGLPIMRGCLITVGAVLAQIIQRIQRKSWN